MSWDAYLKCPTCDSCGANEFNYTHSTNQMVNQARDTVTTKDPEVSWFYNLGGMTGAEAFKFLMAIELELHRFSEYYDRFNPDNGNWGDRVSLCEVLQQMSDASRRNPEHVWVTCG